MMQVTCNNKSYVLSSGRMNASARSRSGSGRAAGAALLAATMFIASACAGGSSVDDAGSASTSERVVIATTVAPITSIVSSIVGDRADVRGIVPEGTNSHTFEPRPSVAELLSEADVVYLNGLVLEEPTKKLAAANIGDDTDIVELGTLSIPESDYIYDFSFPESGGKPNPHLWTDPTLARRYAEVVKDDMSARDPDNAAYYAANYEAFETVIDEFDAAMREAFATIPNRQLLTYHDAYAYFARTYGWTVIGAIQVSDFEEPTASEVAALIEQVRELGVPAIFGSEVFPSPVLEQIGNAAGVEYVDVLRDDDLPGEPGDVEHSWLGLMRFDFITMTEALGGDASVLEAFEVRSTVPDLADYPQ
jgi:ABC-type Zn uptake system ZnuABC Zn-binding protein ZnuA